MYFLPSEEFQTRENRFIKFAARAKDGIYRPRTGSVNVRVRTRSLKRSEKKQADSDKPACARKRFPAYALAFAFFALAATFLRLL